MILLHILFNNLHDMIYTQTDKQRGNLFYFTEVF